MSVGPRIAYFTAGTVGAGHLVRGVALQRALARRGHTEYRIFSPPSPFERIAAPWLETVAIETDLLRDRARADESAIARALRAFAPDRLVIDLFWVPLALLSLPCPAWLLLRSVPRAWLVGPREARFDARRYERVSSIEPAPGLEAFEPIDPIVVCDPSEAAPREALAALVGAREDEPLRLIVRAGLADDQARLDERARAIDPDATWRTLDLSHPAAPFPAAVWLAAMREGDHLVAGAGYNLYWEARAMGFDGHTTFVPLPRKLDDQAMRAVLGGDRPTRNGADVLAEALLSDAASGRIEPSGSRRP